MYFWNAEENSTYTYHFPVQEQDIDTSLIQVAKEKDERISAFVGRINDDFAVGLSFEGNLKSFLEKNKIRKPVQNIVWEAVKNEG